jgi:hypothetical protein
MNVTPITSNITTGQAVDVTVTPDPAPAPLAASSARNTRALVVHGGCLTLSAFIALSVVVFHFGDLALAVWPMGGNLAEIIISFLGRLD